MAENSGKYQGIGFWGLLQIVFITLKLTNLIDWSWGWVLAPLWIVGIFTVIAVAIAIWLANK